MDLLITLGSIYLGLSIISWVASSLYVWKCVRAMKRSAMDEENSIL